VTLASGIFSSAGAILSVRRLLCAGLFVLSLAGTGAATFGAPEAQKDKKEAFENQFLLFGTVFSERGFAFYGARVEVRRSNERKKRWETSSDHRGEFAVRLPKGVAYEVKVSAKGYQELARPVDARTGSRADLVFRLEQRPGGKQK
jgi:hypothetical protein